MKATLTINGKNVVIQGTPEQVEAALDTEIRINPDFWAVVRSAAGNYQAEVMRMYQRNHGGRPMPLFKKVKEA